MSKHWIEQRLQEIGRRKAELADALEIDRSRVSEVLGGRRRIAVNELPKVSRFLRIPVSEVVRQETGDIGFLPEPGRQPEVWPEARTNVGPESAERIFQAARDALIAFNREGFEEMSTREIDIYAKVIARCASRPEPSRLVARGPRS